ncbi:unnamed protein product [Plutella xylostella]|uniref:(diamondback moth) hypothetical protein n=1 Tax=Plutella xylostella TaxID=51655 RepID=A0A8S4ET85_PLUXY|nr:unnamed protein product [Plutella xylostella]
MMRVTIFAVACVVGLATGSPVLRKLESGPRFQYEQDATGQNHLVDTWVTLDNMAESARYTPELQNIYHLFTRENPTVSQPLLINNVATLQSSNYKSSRRTIVLLHGWRDSIVSDFNTVIVPSFLEAEDVNVLCVDWSAGAGSINYNTALANTLTSGVAVADFLNWLISASGSVPVQFHIVGHGLGAHQAGIVGRNVRGDVAYITALDAALIGWINLNDRFQADDAMYTEAIHTNAGVNGYVSDYAHVDFYVNGGESMPGCNSHACDHARAIFYFAESITSGGFRGKLCVNYLAAMLESCNILPGRLNMGGLKSKVGSRGVYLVETNPSPPFSRS